MRSRYMQPSQTQPWPDSKCTREEDSGIGIVYQARRCRTLPNVDVSVSSHRRVIAETGERAERGQVTRLGTRRHLSPGQNQPSNSSRNSKFFFQDHAKKRTFRTRRLSNCPLVYITRAIPICLNTHTWVGVHNHIMTNYFGVVQPVFHPTPQQYYLSVSIFVTLSNRLRPSTI